MLYSTIYLIDRIRSYEREEAKKSNFTIPQLEEKIRHHSRRTNACLAGMLTSAGIGFAGAYLEASQKKYTIAFCLVIVSAGLVGLLSAMGKIHAIKADAYGIAKEELERKV